MQFYQIRAPPATKSRGADTAPLSHMPPWPNWLGTFPARMLCGFKSRRGL